MKIARKSQISNEINTLDLDVTEEQMERFENRVENGEMIQNIFPNLSAPDREFIKSGITPAEWEKTFGAFRK